MQDLTSAQRKGAILECALCHGQAIEGKLSCNCMVHTCGHRPNGTKKLSTAIGRCDDQAHCAYCCSCAKCSKCHKLYKVRKVPFGPQNTKALVCQLCNSCLDGCCRCATCRTCDKRVGKDHCACEVKPLHHAKCCDTDARITQHGPRVLFMPRTPHFAIGTNFQHVRTRRLMSVETEILEVNEPSGFPKFNTVMRDLNCGVVHEGTVPNGFEINSNPASGNLFMQEVEGIIQAIKLVKGSINIRCGTHVHVDARDFHYADLVNLIYLYHKIEPAIFAMLPPWRRISRFAAPCREQLMKIANNGEKMVQILRDPDMASFYPNVLGKQYKKKPSIAVRIAENLYQSRTLREQKLIHKNGSNQRLRYMALNLHSWVYRRTIEFRHWPGSIEQQELLLWAQICAAILDAAKRLPIDQALRGMPTIAKLSKHPVEALLDILRPSSKVSRELRPFAESMIQRWSPDFEVWWPIAQIGGRECVLPFKDQSHDELILGFDIKNKAFTYIGQRLRGNWENEWLPPHLNQGRYAELGDLHAIPDKGSLLWMHKNPEQTPKVKYEPAIALEHIYQRVTRPRPTTTYAVTPAVDAFTFQPFPEDDPVEIEDID